LCYYGHNSKPQADKPSLAQFYTKTTAVKINNNVNIYHQENGLPLAESSVRFAPSDSRRTLAADPPSKRCLPQLRLGRTEGRLAEAYHAQAALAFLGNARAAIVHRKFGLCVKGDRSGCSAKALLRALLRFAHCLLRSYRAYATLPPVSRYAAYPMTRPHAVARSASGIPSPIFLTTDGVNYGLY